MPKPSVAILHYSCPPVIGGVEFIVEAHARELVRGGFQTKLIVGKGGEVHPGVTTTVVPEISSRGGPISSVIRSLSRGQVPRTFEKTVKSVEGKLSRALRGVDVCMMHNVMTMHFNLVVTAALANIMRRKKSIRFIAWTHDLTFGDPVYESHQHRRYPWNLLIQPVPRCQYCVISKQRQQELHRLFRVPASTLPVIPDGIDVPDKLGLTKPIEDLFHDEKLAGVDIVALTPARILRRKNLGVGMEIVAALKKQGFSVRWLVTGAPDAHNMESMKYYRMLVSLRRRLRVQKEVVFLCDRLPGGIVTNSSLRALYSISDVLLLPSDREGFGLPVLEAGLAELLLVISDIPALRELAGRDAIYIRPGDTSDSVAKRVAKAMKKRQQQLYRKKIISNYAWEVVFKEKIVPALLKPATVWKG